MNGNDALHRRGRCWLFGDDVLNDGQIMDMEMTRQMVYDPVRLAPLAMCGIAPAFARQARPGDFVVAGRNFGKGPMHIQGPLALAALGVAILSESMARSFFRLSVSAGLATLPFAVGITHFVREGDDLEVDFGTGIVLNHSQGMSAAFAPMEPVAREIIAAGGEQAWLKLRVPAAGQH